MKNKILFIALFISVLMNIYAYSPRVKFWIHHGIWLPSYCYNYKFIKHPNTASFFGLDGSNTISSFEFDERKMESLIKSINPKHIWVQYSESDSTLKDTTIIYPAKLPIEVINGEVRIMLYDDQVKGDYYNIDIQKTDDGFIASIQTPYT